MLNTIILMGRITADIDLRMTESGVPVCAFTVAVDRRYQRQGEERQADFIPCVAWRQQAEFASKYFFKGSMIAVEGTLQSRRYKDKNGNDRTAYEVIADRISFTGEKREQEAPVAAPAPAPAPAAKATGPVQEKMELSYADYSGDGLPF